MADACRWLPISHSHSNMSDRGSMAAVCSRNMARISSVLPGFGISAAGPMGLPQGLPGEVKDLHIADLNCPDKHIVCRAHTPALQQSACKQKCQHRLSQSMTMADKALLLTGDARALGGHTTMTK